MREGSQQRSINRSVDYHSAMDAAFGKFFDSVGFFFASGDNIPWCDRDIIAEFEDSGDPDGHFQALVSLAKEGVQKGKLLLMLLLLLLFESSIAEAKETVQDLLNPSKRSDLFGFRLRSDVVKAAEALAGLKSSRSRYKRDLQGKVA